MITRTQKRVSRWQVLALAALVLAGGTIAVPQAADAATKTTTCGNLFAERCTTTFKAKNSISFSARSSTLNWWMSYTVRSTSGRLLCSGRVKLNASARSCWFGTYSGPVTISMQKPWGSVLKVTATS